MGDEEARRVRELAHREVGRPCPPIPWERLTEGQKDTWRDHVRWMERRQG